MHCTWLKTISLYSTHAGTPATIAQHLPTLPAWPYVRERAHTHTSNASGNRRRCHNRMHVAIWFGGHLRLLIHGLSLVQIYSQSSTHKWTHFAWCHCVGVRWTMAACAHKWCVCRQERSGLSRLYSSAFTNTYCTYLFNTHSILLSFYCHKTRKKNAARNFGQMICQ